MTVLMTQTTKENIGKQHVLDLWNAFQIGEAKLMGTSIAVLTSVNAEDWEYLGLITPCGGVGRWDAGYYKPTPRLHRAVLALAVFPDATVPEALACYERQEQEGR